MYRCVVVVKRQALDALDEITNSCVVEREWRIRIDREIEIVVKVSDELTSERQGTGVLIVVNRATVCLIRARSRVSFSTIRRVPQ